MLTCYLIGVVSYLFFFDRSCSLEAVFCAVLVGFFGPLVTVAGFLYRYVIV